MKKKRKRESEAVKKEKQRTADCFVPKKSRTKWPKDPHFATLVKDWIEKGPSKFDSNGE